MRWLREPEVRLQILGVLMLAVLSIMVARLWYVQVKEGHNYAAKISRGSEITVRIPSVRGEIRDRNGVPLVQNRANYEVDLYLPDIVSAYRNEGKPVPIREVERISTSGMKNMQKEADILPIMEETILPRLAQLSEKGVDVLRNFNAEQVQRHYSNNRYVPYTYIEKLDFATICQLAEHDVALPGVELTQKAVRHYVYGAMAAHILGYVGAPRDIKNLPDIDDFNYYQPDVQGRLSIEKALDADLRGQPGVRILRKNAKGQIDGVASERKPVPGSTVYLTLDARIQYITEMALRQSGAGRAAAVVVDPNNGNILAMASLPSFDPNIFIPSVSEENWQVLEDDPTVPLLNRAISGFAPGSTYKIMIALAGLSANISPSRRFSCIGGVQYGNKFMKCHIFGKGSHGSVDLSAAIKTSCNSFFYQYGNEAGIDKITEMGQYLGLGMGSELPVSGENPGILPSKTWLRNTYREGWTASQTANTSIGQGFVLASPLQMAMLSATVANGGLAYYPRLVDKIVKADGTVVEDPPRMRTSLIQKGLTPEQIEVVRYGMWRVVNDGGGTARRAIIKGVDVAGKTGTAQAWRTTGEKDNHVWFMAFAPYKAPKYAVAVIIQGGKSGGGVAAPVVKKILEESLALDKGYNPPVAPLEPAKGSFRQLDSVNFESAVPAESSPDEETSDSVQAPQFSESDPVQRAARTKPVAERPNVREAPDAGGKVKEKKQGFLERIFKPKPGSSPSVEKKRTPKRTGGRP